MRTKHQQNDFLFIARCLCATDEVELRCTTRGWFVKIHRKSLIYNFTTRKVIVRGLDILA